MKKYLALLLLASVSQWGCEFIGGAATGALATGAGYEFNAKRQMDRLEDDYRRERIHGGNMNPAKVRSSPARLFTDRGLISI